MFERYTQNARSVMDHARQEAQKLKHDHVGTEHVLLGLAEVKSGVAYDILIHRDICLKTVKAEIVKLVQNGTGHEDTDWEKLPRTKHCQNMVDDAVKEARELKHNHIGTEHLLLGLLHENEGTGAQVIRNMGLKLDQVRIDVLHFLGKA
ncbi:MAG: hypothetical protein JEZ07_04870 [Phycisphaerae bacterium]|nr:hypothetical protein [Phycisphaerae bacterium]